MSREICQFPKLKAQAIISRCVDCSAQEGCSDAVALQLVLLGRKPEDGRLQIMRKCSRFQPFSGSFYRGERDLTPALAEAGIGDLCETCPSETKSACAHRRQTDQVIRIAEHQGRKIEPIVVACTSVKEVAECKKLWQISEPTGQ